MKKFYLLLAGLAVAGMSQARELTFWYGDQKIEPNSTIHFDEISQTPAGTVMEPELYISSDIFTNKATISATSTSGQSIQMCAGGNCEQGVSVTKKDVTLRANQKLDLEFEYVHSGTGEVPTVIVTFEAQDGAYTSTNISYTLVMNGENSSLTLIENKKALRYTSAGLEYNLDGNGVIALYDITGRQVLNVAAEGQGTINTHALRTGLYIYSLRTDKGNKTTGKIYVK